MRGWPKMKEAGTTVAVALVVARASDLGTFLMHIFVGSTLVVKRGGRRFSPGPHQLHGSIVHVAWHTPKNLALEERVRRQGVTGCYPPK